MQSKPIIDYCNKLILAPMVRGSLLPFRLLALRHGADLVYSEEIVDTNILPATRKINDVLGTVDFVDEANANLVFRACPSEKQKLVFQIGTANATRAIQVAKMVQNDVSAIDVNMGCPKPFSTHSGMGAALLSNVKLAKSIVQGLVENIPLPITCKIRISHDIRKTISMVKDFEALGVSAVAVHGRTTDQDRFGSVSKNAIRKIAENVRIPIIANGGSQEMNDLLDVLKFKEDCGAVSVMVARAAQKNVSIFRKEGLIPESELIVEYLKLCVDYDHCFENCHYALKCMRRPIDGKKTQTENKFGAAESLEEICDRWNLGDYYRQKQSEFQAKGYISWYADVIQSRRKMLSDRNIIAEPIVFQRKFFDSDTLPKDVLNAYCERNNLSLPKYETDSTGQKFSSVMTFQEKQYSTVDWQRDFESVEQASALVCALHLGLYEKDYLTSIGCLVKS